MARTTYKEKNHAEEGKGNKRCPEIIFKLKKDEAKP